VRLYFGSRQEIRKRSWSSGGTSLLVRVLAQRKLRMTARKCTGWVNDMTGSPKIQGNLEISKNESGIFIGGDPDGLRSLARLLTWLADIDQNSLDRMPDGERCHLHLHAHDAEGFNSLTWFSEEAELCRLDAKGTCDLPPKYQELETEKPPRRASQKKQR
jgi:hypothetical protein